MTAVSTLSLKYTSCSVRVQRYASALSSFSKFGKINASLTAWFATRSPFCPKVAPHWLSFSGQWPGGLLQQTCTSKGASSHKVEWLWWCLQVHSSASSNVQTLSLEVGVCCVVLCWCVEKRSNSLLGEKSFIFSFFLGNFLFYFIF